EGSARLRRAEQRSSRSLRPRARSGFPVPHEQRTFFEAQAVRPKAHHRVYGRNSVLHAAAETDTGGLLEVPHRHWNVTDPKAEVHGLREELTVEHEIIRVPLKRNRLQNLP